MCGVGMAGWAVRPDVGLQRGQTSMWMSWVQRGGQYQWLEAQPKPVRKVNSLVEAVSAVGRTKFHFWG